MASSLDLWSPLPEDSPYSTYSPLGLGNISTPASIVSVDSEPGWQEWEVKDMVQSWVTAPNTNSGMLLTCLPTLEASLRRFASSTHSDSAKRPKMVISALTMADTDNDNDFDGLDIAALAAAINER